MKKIRKQIILMVSMAFLMLAVCSAVAAAEVSNNGTQIQAQNQTVSQITSYTSTNINSVQSNTNNAGSINTGTTEQPSKVVISGKVTKCSTGEPFPGATVTAEKDGTELASTTTKEDGTYNLEFLSDSGVFNVTASYPGHEPSSKEVNVTPDQNGTNSGTADFQLGVPETFVDDNWVGLPNGTVVFFPGDPNPHTIGTDAFATISDGVINANPGGTVHIADGTYTGAGNINVLIDKDLTIVGQSQAGTIIDAQGSDRIFNVQLGNTVTISNITFANGNSSTGGAIANGGTLTVTDCTFTGNHADIFGGAIYNLGGTLTVNSSTFEVNNASGDGGAIFNDGGDLTVTGSTFTGNTATGTGGAIYNNDNLTVNGSTFEVNNADIGGAINNDGTLTVSGSTFNSNHANIIGGAIRNAGPMNVTGSNFINNSAGNGGAIWNFGGDASNRKFNFNRIIGNSPSNSEVFSDSGTLDATLNWWGSNLSPAGKISTSNGGVVIFDPWLVLTITANPTTIFNGGTSQVTADLLHDSNGVYHDPALGHVPDGIPITLTTNWGSFTNPAINHSITLGTVNGAVTATFFANEGPTPGPPLNPVQVNATADDQTVTTFITILEPPAPPIVVTAGGATAIVPLHPTDPVRAITPGISAIAPLLPTDPVRVATPRVSAIAPQLPGDPVRAITPGIEAQIPPNPVDVLAIGVTAGRVNLALIPPNPIRVSPISLFTQRANIGFL